MKYQQVNYLMDVIMPKLANTNAFAVVSVIARNTWGMNGTEWVELSYKDLMDATGIKSVNTVKVAIEAAAPFIEQQPKETQGFIYRMKTVSNFDIVENETVSNSAIANSDTLSKIDTEPYQNLTPPLSKNDTVSRGTLKEKEKKNIYTRGNIPPYELPAEAMPFSEHALLRDEIVMAITGTVKTASVGSEDDFEKAAEWIIGQGVTEAKTVMGFREWWHDNGYYKGKPALKSFLDEFSNYLDGVTTASETDKVRTAWGQVKSEIQKNGRRSTKSWNGTIAPALKKAGGYTRLCSVSLHEAEKLFSQAFQDMERIPA